MRSVRLTAHQVAQRRSPYVDQDLPFFRLRAQGLAVARRLAEVFDQGCVHARSSDAHWKIIWPQLPVALRGTYARIAHELEQTYEHGSNHARRMG